MNNYYSAVLINGYARTHLCRADENCRSADAPCRGICWCSVDDGQTTDDDTRVRDQTHEMNSDTERVISATVSNLLSAKY